MEATLLSVLLQATVSGAVVMGTATVKHRTVTTVSAMMSLAMVLVGFKMCRQDLRLSALHYRFCIKMEVRALIPSSLQTIIQ